MIQKSFTFFMPFIKKINKYQNTKERTVHFKVIQLHFSEFYGVINVYRNKQQHYNVVSFFTKKTSVEIKPVG